jgi:uncharacterized protein YjbJ (UPF0337 family)
MSSALSDTRAFAFCERAHRELIRASHQERHMNWDTVEGNWKELKGKIRSKWAKLTDDDLENIAGKKDVLLGRLQQHYGFKKDEAEKQVDAFLTSDKDA